MYAADLTRWLLGLIARATKARPDPGPLRRRAADVLAEDMARRFDAGRDPDGRAWAALARPGPPLVRSGRLRAAAVAMARQARVDAGGDGVVVALDPGLLPDYGRYQNDGTRTLPAREFVGVSAEALDRITAEAADALARAAASRIGGG